MKKLLVYLLLAVVLTACVTNASRPPIGAKKNELDAPAKAQADAKGQTDTKAQAIAACKAWAEASYKEKEAAYKAKMEAAQPPAKKKSRKGLFSQFTDLVKQTGFAHGGIDKAEAIALGGTGAIMLAYDLQEKGKEKAKKKAEEEEREKKMQPQLDKLCADAWQAVLREHK